MGQIKQQNDVENMKDMPGQFNIVSDTGVTFADIAGCDAAKAELLELVKFLKHPEPYVEAGCRLPKGCLMYGPPGVGKTMLAKATAGEAGVAFIACSGSDFLQMYVGVGSSRVRDLFNKAKAAAPCLVFIDEVDAIGGKRGSSGNVERESTLNQILHEMDGFKKNNGVMVLAATNLPGSLVSMGGCS